MLNRITKRLNELLILMCCTSCSSTIATEAPMERLCGEDAYHEVIALTEQRVVEAYSPTFPMSPYPDEVSAGCVGMSFSINPDGYAFDIKIRNTSHPRIFNRAARKALQKYRFQKDMETFKNAYLVITFGIDK